MNWFESEKKRPRDGTDVILYFEENGSICRARYSKQYDCFSIDVFGNIVLPRPQVFWIKLSKPNEKRRKYRRIICTN